MIFARPDVRRGVIARLQQTRAVAVAQLQKCRAAFHNALGEVSSLQLPPSEHMPDDAATVPSLPAGHPPEQPHVESEPVQSGIQEGSLQSAAAEAADADMGEAEHSEGMASRESSLADDAMRQAGEGVSMQSHPVLMLHAQPADATASAQGFAWVNNSCGPDFLSMCLAACWHEIGSSTHNEQPLGALLGTARSQFSAAMADGRLQRSILDLIYAEYASYAIMRNWRPGMFTGMPALVEAVGSQLSNIHLIDGTVNGHCETCGAHEESPRRFPYISLVRIPRCAPNCQYSQCLLPNSQLP